MVDLLDSRDPRPRSAPSLWTPFNVPTNPNPTTTRPPQDRPGRRVCPPVMDPHHMVHMSRIGIPVMSQGRKRVRQADQGETKEGLHALAPSILSQLTGESQPSLLSRVTWSASLAVKPHHQRR
jgi:hypothetical protein